jgi:aldose 1-epimerase
MPSSLTSRPFGTLPSGEPVTAFTLTGAGGLSLQVMTYGGIVTHLRAPDRDGSFDDVVLGFDDFAPYLAGHPYFGAIAGRVAGRTTGARFVLDGRTYDLACNHPPNHLHGGLIGLDKRLWTAHPVDRPDHAPSLRLTYHSPDGEEGYPGAVDIAVTYTVTAANAFIIDSEAVADRPTPFSLTHHGYFNLAGESAGSIDDHELQIHADETVAVDERFTLLGQRVPVKGQPNDFSQPRRLGDAIPHLYQQHGDLYLIPGAAAGTSALVPVARVTEPRAGRVLTVSTTERCFQFYSGVSLDGACTGKLGRPYRAHAGLCLECEGYPDGANNPAFGDILLRPGQPSRQTTVYSFSTY